MTEPRDSSTLPMGLSPVVSSWTEKNGGIVWLLFAQNSNASPSIPLFFGDKIHGSHQVEGSWRSESCTLPRTPKIHPTIPWSQPMDCPEQLGISSMGKTVYTWHPLTYIYWWWSFLNDILRKYMLIAVELKNRCTIRISGLLAFQASWAAKGTPLNRTLLNSIRREVEKQTVVQSPAFVIAKFFHDLLFSIPLVAKKLKLYNCSLMPSGKSRPKNDEQKFNMKVETGYQECGGFPPIHSTLPGSIQPRTRHLQPQDLKKDGVTEQKEIEFK